MRCARDAAHVVHRPCLVGARERIDREEHLLSGPQHLGRRRTRTHHPESATPAAQGSGTAPRRFWLAPFPERLLRSSGGTAATEHLDLPGVLLFASRDLTFIAGGAAVLIASLATDPILVIYCFLPFQAAAIWQTTRDRYLVDVFKARMR